MKDPTLVAHKPAEIAMMNFFLFQMAMLAESMSKILLGKMAALPKMLRTTYMRSTIKREAPATARYPKNYKRRKREENILLLRPSISGGRLTNWKMTSTWGSWPVRMQVHIDRWWTRHTWQLILAASSEVIRQSITAMRVATRVTEYIYGKDAEPENKCVPVRTTIVHRYGRCPRMIPHSKSRVVTNSQLRRGGGPSYPSLDMSDCERGVLGAG